MKEMRSNESAMVSVLQSADEPSRDRVLRNGFWSSSPARDHAMPIPLDAARSRRSRP
jgi:hypothetical protein